MKVQNTNTNGQSQGTGLLIQASRVKRGDLIKVQLLSGNLSAGTVTCKTLKRSKQGWLVSYCGSSPMPVKWSFDLQAWVFSDPSAGEHCVAFRLW